MNNETKMETNVDKICIVATATSFIGAGLLGAFSVVRYAITNRRDCKLLKMIYSYDRDVIKYKYDLSKKLSLQPRRNQIRDYLDKYGYSTQSITKDTTLVNVGDRAVIIYEI